MPESGAGETLSESLPVTWAEASNVWPAAERDTNMHDDQPGGVPQGPKLPNDVRVVMRHFDKPVSLRELLHSTLDRLLDEMIRTEEPAGVVAVTNLDEHDTVMGGRTVVLALDLDPAAHEYDDCGLGEPENP